MIEFTTFPSQAISEDADFGMNNHYCRARKPSFGFLSPSRAVLSSNKRQNGDFGAMLNTNAVFVGFVGKLDNNARLDTGLRSKERAQA